MTPGAILSIIRQQLRECPGCHYSLTAASSNICPECGRDLTDDVSLYLERQAGNFPEHTRVATLTILPNAAVFFWLFVTGWTHRGRPGLGIWPAIIFIVLTAPALLLWFLLLRSRAPLSAKRSLDTRFLLAAAWIWPAFVTLAYRVF